MMTQLDLKVVSRDIRDSDRSGESVKLLHTGLRDACLLYASLALRNIAGVHHRRRPRTDFIVDVTVVHVMRDRFVDARLENTRLCFGTMRDFTTRWW